jgi:hypothetical protein
MQFFGRCFLPITLSVGSSYAVKGTADTEIQQWKAVLSHFHYHRELSLHANTILSALEENECFTEASVMVKMRVEALASFHTSAISYGGDVDYVSLIDSMEPLLAKIKNNDRSITLVNPDCKALVLFVDSIYAGVSIPFVSQITMQSWYPVLSILSSISYQIERLFVLTSFNYWKIESSQDTQNESVLSVPITFISRCGRRRIAWLTDGAIPPIVESNAVIIVESSDYMRPLHSYPRASPVVCLRTSQIDGTLYETIERCGGTVSQAYRISNHRIFKVEPTEPKLVSLKQLYSSLKVTKKQLIYSCVSMQGCGGNGDRLNGIVTSFLLSLLFKREFKIHSDFPLPFSWIFEPSDPDTLDWRVHITSLIPDHLEYTDDRLKFSNDLRDGILEQYYSGISPDGPEAVTIAINHLSIETILSLPSFLLPELRNVRNVFNEIFKFLFQPTKYLVNHVKRVSQSAKLTRPFIGIHFRSGAGMGQNWTDPQRHTVGDLKIFMNCVQQLHAEEYFGGDDPLWLISSDVHAKQLSLVFEQIPEVIRTENFRFFDVTISHIDRTNDVVDQVIHSGFVNAWASWWIMANHSSALVLSRSGFGETAARIRDLPPSHTRFFRNCMKIDFS